MLMYMMIVEQIVAHLLLLVIAAVDVVVAVVAVWMFSLDNFSVVRRWLFVLMITNHCNQK